MLILKVVISCSKISKDWTINGNMNKGEKGPRVLETPKNIVMRKVIVEVNLKVVGRGKSLGRRVKSTHTVAGKSPAND